MSQGPELQLYDPRRGGVSLRIEGLAAGDRGPFQRSNYFTVHWVRRGRGIFYADLGAHPFGAESLLCLVPYQSFRLAAEEPLEGLTVQFHANFLCIETHHEEVGCNGVLFNDTYGVPVVRLEAGDAGETALLLGQMERELREQGLAHGEVLLSYLKIFLVRASRMKVKQQPAGYAAAGRVPEVLTALRERLEEHFRHEHSPAAYAGMLHTAPKTLARLVKQHWNKTLTELIRERVAREAKWQMLHTLKPVKQVAAELGFDDVFYFSRFFKRATGCSPQFFREYETAIREGRNLSMP